MSSEPPPQPISNTFNYSQWNRDQNLTIASAAFRYLSKVVSDTAAGLISFASGIKTNTINAFSGTVMTIGDGTTTNLNLYSPKLASALAISSNDTSIVSSAWVKSWFTDILNNSTLTWFQLQNFSGGISTATIQSYFSTVITIGNSSSTANNIYKPVLASAIPSSTDNSTSIISSAWVNSFWSLVRSNAYSWSGIQTFTNGIYSNDYNCTGGGVNVNIANDLISGNLFIGKNVGYYGSINLGTTGGARVYTSQLETQYLATNNVSAINVGDTITINNAGPGSQTNIGSAGYRTANVTIGSGGLSTGDVGINNGIGSTGAVILGTASSTVAVDAVATFSTLPFVSASYAGIIGSNNSTTIITTNWINATWLIYLRTLANTWSAVQTFSALPLSTGSYAAITGGDTSNTIITSNWINSTWLPYLRGLANTWTLLQTFTAGISCTLPIRVTYAPSSITSTTMIGYRFPADVSSVTVTSTRRCQCVLNGTAGVGAVLPAGVYTVSYTALLPTTTTGYLAGIVVRGSITNGTTSATGGVLNLYGGLQQRSQSTTGPFYISGSTTLVLDGTDCVSIGIESTTTQSANCDMWCQAIRIA